MDSAVFHIIKDGIIYELEPEDEGGYVISVPALPGCISTGGTIEEALAMIAEAMDLWLEVAREKGFPIPAQLELLRQAC